MLIERAGIDDLADILEIELLCFRDDRFNSRQLRYLLGKARASNWIARCELDSAGYCIGLLPAPPRPARLYSIAVLPRYRGHGLASQLLGRFLSDSISTGHSRVRLEVSAGNRAAIDLYRRFGFTTLKVLPGYYHGNVDALRMEWCADSRVTGS